MKKILIIDNSIAIRNIIRNLFTDNQRILIYEANFDLADLKSIFKEIQNSL